MILTEKIEKKVTHHNIRIFRKFGFNIGDLASVNIEYWNRNSHEKILVKCDICEKESIKPYRQYMNSFEKFNIYCCSPTCAQMKNKKTCLEKYGCDNVSKNIDVINKIKNTHNEKYGTNSKFGYKEIRNKAEKTLLNNYGVTNPMHSNDLKEKIKKTCLEKYGTENYNASDLAKEIRVKNNKQISDLNRSDYEKYKIRVRYLTKINKNTLIENWDGYDYYDNEYIKDNYDKFKFFDKNYPTIDHKISIYYGYSNNIDPLVISDLTNICITKRSINSQKNYKCHWGNI